MGREGRIILDIAVKAASGSTVGARTEIVGTIVLVITAPGTFGEIQSARNAIWKTSPEGISLASFLRARLLSLALVIGLGVLLLVSMIATAFVQRWHVSETLGNAVVTGELLPDIDLEWADVAVRAVGTAALCKFGQLLIGVYLHNTCASARLFRGGRPDCGASVDLLLSAGLPPRSGAHEKLCQPAGFEAAHTAENSCLLRLGTWRCAGMCEITTNMASGARAHIVTRRMA